ncbi:hypothetical protein GIB67_011768, partial [Kingdonia uniflora]
TICIAEYDEDDKVIDEVWSATDERMDERRKERREARERDDTNKSRVLRKGLEKILDSVKLWKAVVELANEEYERLLLQRVVNYFPLHVELWLALASFETYKNAKVLNKARERLFREPAIWIKAAQLEDANGNTVMVGKILGRGIRPSQIGVEINRGGWMKEAEAAE